MAPETARRCEEKREGRGLSPGRAVRHCSLQPFWRPEDMVFSPGYFVAKGSKMDKHFHRLRSSYPNEKPHTIFDPIREFTTLLQE